MTVTPTHKHLVHSPKEECEKRGANTKLEYLVKTNDGILRSIDLVVWIDNIVIAVEIERSTSRIENDINKAIALQADTLIILVPNPRLRKLVKKRVRQLIPPKTTPVFVGCLPEVIRQLATYFPM